MMSRYDKGMWVLLEGAVGILAENKTVVVDATADRRHVDPTTGEVHLVDGAGDTIRVVRGVQLMELQQAGLEDIPAKRRPDPLNAARMGYV